MPFDPASFAVSAGTSVLGPLVAKGLGSMFGLDEPGERERAAREGLQRLAGGRVATPAQLMLQQQKNDTLKSLQSLASRGTAQQQAGNVRAAMQAAPGIQQQQAGQLAALRASEMQQAQSALSQLEQQQGSQDRKYMQGLIGAGVSGAAGAGAMAMTQSPDKDAGSLKGNAAEAYNEEQAQMRAQHYKSMPSVPVAAPVQAAAAAPVQAAAERPASGGLALRDQTIGAGVGYRVPQVKQDTLSLGQPNLRTKRGQLQAKGAGLASYLTNGTLNSAGDTTLTPPFGGY